MPLLWVGSMLFCSQVVLVKIRRTCRAGVCEGLEFLGVKLDPEKNKVRGEEAIISTDDSRVKVVVIPTDEELLIASDTMAILDK